MGLASLNNFGGFWGVEAVPSSLGDKGRGIVAQIKDEGGGVGSGLVSLHSRFLF